MREITLFFEPLDVLVFRDHRPFLAGQNFLARSTFPLPSVFFGALRAALFERAGVRFTGDRNEDPFAALSDTDRQLLGDADTPGLLELAGPLLARRRDDDLDLFFPWPRDLDVAPRKDDPDHLDVHPVVPSPHRAGLRWTGVKMAPLDAPLPARVAAVELDKPSEERLLLTEAGARAYLQASAAGLADFSLTPPDFVHEKLLMTKEPRTGIARTRGEDGPDPLVVDESMLYTVETWRLSPGTGFAVGLSLPDSPHEAHLRELLADLHRAPLRLGGKGHLARVHRLDRPLLRDLDVPRLTSPAGFKSWCLTPSLLDPAAEPRPTLVLGDTLRLGGINLRGKSGKGKPVPRPLVGALDRGAVLYFPATSTDLSARIRTANEARGSDSGHPLHAGYGLHAWIPYAQPTRS